MSTPKMQHIQGDVNISPGLDTSQGLGSMYITGPSAILSVIPGQSFFSQTTVDTTGGVFSVTGTNNMSVTLASSAVQIAAGAASYFTTSAGNLSLTSTSGVIAIQGASATLSSTSTTVAVTGATGIALTSTANNVNITCANNFNVDASNAITMDANATSYLTVTGSGNVTMSSTAGRAIITGGSASSNAVTITASSAAGGVQVDGGTAGINMLATDGPFSLAGQNAASTISLATNADAQDLLIAVTGVSNSTLRLNSSGTASDAIQISALAVTGGIDMNTGTGGYSLISTGTVTLNAAANSNFTTTGAFDLSLSSTLGRVLVTGGSSTIDSISLSATDTAGGISLSSGTNGTTSNTTGGMSLNSQATSNITLTGTADLTVNNTSGRLILQSNKASADAIKIYAINAAGGITGITGTGGINLSSQGLVSLSAVGAASNFTVATNSAAQNLTLAVTGSTNSSVIISSSGTSNTSAIQITASAGGIDMTSTGLININTTNLSSGIQIGTGTSGVPVVIGTSTSTTTIAGNLLVSGTQTIINSETLTVTDNVILLNSGNGELGADAGLIIRRNQTPNDTNDGGNVIQDTQGVISGLFQAGSNAGTGTLKLSASASIVDDFYKGDWIVIDDGVGIDQVRRIKSYVGATRIATIYVTADNVSGFIDGLDLTTAPAAGDAYSIYNGPYVASYYRESTDKWTLSYSNLAPDAIATVGVSTVNIQRYIDFTCGAIVVQSNGVVGGSSINVDVINEFTSNAGVTIEGVLIKDGLINDSPLDDSEIVLLIDNSTGFINVTNTAIHGSYIVSVDAVQSASGAGSYLRQTGGAFGVFAIASSGTGGAVNLLASSRGSSNQRIDGTWSTGQVFQIKHSQTFTGGTGASIPYRVKVQRVVV